MGDKIQDVMIYFQAKDLIIEDRVINLENGETRLRRKIAAITEGVHNQINFEKEEIEKAALATRALAEQEGRTEIVPAVIDHCDSIECLIGAATEISAGKVKTTDGKSVQAIILGVDYDEDTPRQRDAAAIIRKHPALVMNSIRARGKIAEDEKGALYMKDFILVHLGHVLDPADRNAKGIEQSRTSCSRKKGGRPADFALNTAAADATGMGENDQARLQELEAKVAELTARNQDLEAKVQAKDTELAETKAALEQARKEPIVAAILARKPDFNQDLLKEMTHTQLQALQTELQALAPTPGTRNTGKGSAAGGAGQAELTAEQKADALFGAL